MPSFNKHPTKGSRWYDVDMVDANNFKMADLASHAVAMGVGLILGITWAAAGGTL